MSDFKYEKVQDIKEFPKYKELCKAMHNVVREPTELNKYNAIELSMWYYDQLTECKEYMIKFKEWFNREYISQFVDVKDIAIGDKNIFECKNLEESK